MNAASSRSHAVLTLSIKQGPLNDTGETSGAGGGTEGEVSAAADIGTIRSKISLVDLAGSERAKSTGAAGQRLKVSGPCFTLVVLQWLEIDVEVKLGLDAAPHAKVCKFTRFTCPEPILACHQCAESCSIPCTWLCSMRRCGSSAGCEDAYVSGPFSQHLRTSCSLHLRLPHPSGMERTPPEAHPRRS